MKVSRRSVILGMCYAGLAQILDPFRSFSKWMTVSAATESDWKNLSLFADVIFPKTETTPSATEVNVIGYLKHLSRSQIPFYKLLKPKTTAQKILNQFSKRLDDATQAKYKAHFSNLTAELREEIVASLSQHSTNQVGYKITGTGDKNTYSDSELFSNVRAYVIQGYFAEPAYGGNKNYKAWEAIKHICHFNYPKSKDSCP